MKRLGTFGLLCIISIVAVIVASMCVDAKKKSNKKLRQASEQVAWQEPSNYYNSPGQSFDGWKKRSKKQKSSKKAQHIKENQLGHASGSMTAAASTALTGVRINSRYSNFAKQYEAMTVNFNPSYRVPNCVSYLLTSQMIDITNGPNAEIRRNYKFYCDPSVSGCPEWWEYKGSGYDRGHMAPANDMRWSRQSMSDCFLMTNICPQDHDLNGGSWNKLELKVHDWAKRYGKIVVATGPIFNGNSRRIGPNGDIVVPSGFFKVVLDPSRNRAIGFIYENHEGGGGMARHACSVDEVERITGHDFFSALPDNVERTVESTFNFDQW